MALLKTLIRSPRVAAPKVIVYGQPGVGKTSLAASAGAVLLDCENGAGAVPELTRTPYLKTWGEMQAWLQELASAPEVPSVVAVDTLDWMVQRIIEYAVIDLDGKKPSDITNTLGTAHGGYYKAREIVQNLVYRDLLPLLNAINDRGAAILLLGHAAHTKMTLPEGFDIRLAAPDLPSWVAPVFIEWADAVLYAVVSSDGKRVLHTEGTQNILAKNRYTLPTTLPLSWQSLVAALAKTAGAKAQATKGA
jgi:hypothetical protein